MDVFRIAVGEYSSDIRKRGEELATAARDIPDSHTELRNFVEQTAGKLLGIAAAIDAELAGPADSPSLGLLTLTSNRYVRAAMWCAKGIGIGVLGYVGKEVAPSLLDGLTTLAAYSDQIVVLAVEAGIVSAAAATASNDAPVPSPSDVVTTATAYVGVALISGAVAVADDPDVAAIVGIHEPP